MIDEIKQRQAMRYQEALDKINRHSNRLFWYQDVNKESGKRRYVDIRTTGETVFAIERFEDADGKVFFLYQMVPKTIDYADMLKAIGIE